MENLKKYKQVYLISYPRCGRHYLALLMELYTGHPLRTEYAYLKKQKNHKYFVQMAHGLCLDGKENIEYRINQIQGSNVIYLERIDFLSVVFSYMYYHRHKLDSYNAASYFLHEYDRHLKKWHTKFKGNMLTVTYENLLKDDNEFKKICNFVSIRFNADKLHHIKKYLTKKKVRELCGDLEPVNVTMFLNDKMYEEKREIFKKTFSEKLIQELNDDSYIKHHFLQ